MSRLQLWLCRKVVPREPESDDVFELEFDDELPATAAAAVTITASKAPRSILMPGNNGFPKIIVPPGSLRTGLARQSVPVCD